MTRTAIPLTTGTLDIRVDRADWPLDTLCAFAARANPRRAFLVVSKVLGRHMAVAPATMRRTVRDLAARVPRDLPGPVLVIGLAETAICLGQGVHEELLLATGRDDLLFLHTTRQRLDRPLLARFEEPHSHASTHLIYDPGDPRYAAARSLILVDDEISTGTTLVNLACALAHRLPALASLTTVALTDWSEGAFVGRMPAATTRISLLEGKLDWRATSTAPESAAFERTALAVGSMERHHNFGRIGRADIASEGDAIAAALALDAGSRLRVLGTGEFTYPPFRLAERLEAMGHDVVVQSTTRSPAHLAGPMKSRLVFEDNYGTGVPNYLYNVDPGDGRLTLICHETPPDSIDKCLVSALGARTLYFGDCG